MSAPICQYWLQGNCRFGKSCWYRHEAPAGRGGPTATGKKIQDWRQMSDEDILKGISAEINTWGTGKIWPLSVFSFGKDAPILPGLKNYSFEEIRWEAYQAKANNTFSEYVNKLEKLLGEARQQKQMLKTPDATFRVKLLEFINQAKGPVSSATLFGGSTTNSAPSGTFQNAFGGSGGMFQPSAFGQVQLQQQQPPAGSGIFGQEAASRSQLASNIGQPSLFTSQTPSTAVAAQQFTFGSIPQPAPTQSQQNLPVMQQQNLTAVTNTIQQNATTGAFSPATVQTSSVPPSSASVSAPQTDQPKLLFGKQVEASASSNAIETDIYSHINDLSQVELESFKAEQFNSLEDIPIRPPPKELCF